ncbi:MAG: redoxin domain-containing protein [Actinomycetota bacterium]
MRAIRWAAITMVGASVVLALAFATRFGDDPNLVPSPLLGQPAPLTALPKLDGSGSIDPSAFDGKVVVVNFFASWCLPCRNEQPVLSATADAFANRQVVLVEIAYQDRAEAALAFLEETGTSPNALYLADPGGRAAIAFGVFGIPETFLISREGIVVAKMVGATNALALGVNIDAVLRGETPGQDVLGETFTGPSG